MSAIIALSNGVRDVVWVIVIPSKARAVGRSARRVVGILVVRVGTVEAVVLKTVDESEVGAKSPELSVAVVAVVAVAAAWSFTAVSEFDAGSAILACLRRRKPQD